jgi:hypothetical protein
VPRPRGGCTHVTDAVLCSEVPRGAPLGGQVARVCPVGRLCANRWLVRIWPRLRFASLGPGILAVQVEMDRLKIVQARWSRAADEYRIWEASGHRDMASWLAAKAKTTKRTARDVAAWCGRVGCSVGQTWCGR